MHPPGESCCWVSDEKVIVYATTFPLAVVSCDRQGRQPVLVSVSAFEGKVRAFVKVFYIAEISGNEHFLCQRELTVPTPLPIGAKWPSEGYSVMNSVCLTVSHLSVIGSIRY